MVSIYSVGEPGLVLDDEFTKFLPPLTDEERAGLTESIKANGCLSPLVVWRNGDGREYLLDGYHRYEICQELQVPFKVHRIDGLATREEAMSWMLNHQASRRNLSVIQRMRIACEFRESLEREAKDRQKTGKRTQPSENGDVAPEVIDKGRVNERIGALAGVSAEHVRRFRQIEKHATPEELADLDAGKTTINKLYQKYKPSVESEKPADVSPPAWKAEDPEQASLAAPNEPEAVAEDDVEVWLATLPLSKQLTGRQLDIFKKDAADYLHFEPHRKKLGDVARHRFKKGGGKGPWARALIRFLKCEHPKDWLICPTPENGGCSGKGVYEFGECPRCHGAGYWIKGTYAVSVKS